MTNTIILKDNTLVNIIDLLKDLLEECIISFTKESIKINTIDKSMTSFIDIKVVDVYEKCTLKKDTVINLRLEDLHKVLASKDKNEKIQITFKQDTIEVKFINNENEGYGKYKIKLLQVENFDEIPDIDVEPNTQLVMASKYFTSLCRKIKKFDESLLIECNEDDNEVLIKSGTEDSVELKIVEEQGKLNKLTIEEDVKIMVLLKFIMAFTKGDKFSEQVIINIQDECSALELIYQFEDSYIKFYTSPQDIED